MVELLILIAILGLAISSQSRMGVANPFFVYFVVWTSVFSGYYAFASTFYPISLEFVLLILSSTFSAFVILLLVYFGKRKEKPVFNSEVPAFREGWLGLLQMACLISVPFAYEKANALSNQVDIFSVAGYMTLRSSVTEDGQNFGLLNYFSILSYAISSIRAYKYSTDRSKSLLLAASLAVSIFYAYVNTGRTGFLLLTLLLVVPLVLRGAIRRKGIVVCISLLAAMFLMVALMTEKGASSEDGISENITSLGANLRSYTIAPLLAFSNLEGSFQEFSYGANSFRFILSLTNALGLSEFKIASLVRDYAYVPDPTNVYTVYDTYFRDFSYLGVFIPPAFLIFHWWLYAKVFSSGGKWVFYYSASLYPLSMQFFSDQYFSLLSIWIQLAVWYWLLVPKKGRG